MRPERYLWTLPFVMKIVMWDSCVCQAHCQREHGLSPLAPPNDCIVILFVHSVFPYPTAMPKAGGDMEALMAYSNLRANRRFSKSVQTRSPRVLVALRYGMSASKKSSGW